MAGPPAATQPPAQDDRPPADAAAKGPDKLPAWFVPGLLGLGLLALLVGFGASQAAGSTRRLLLIALYVCALGVPLLASARAIRRPQASVVGGAGYVVPQTALEKVLHPLLSLLYNAGLMVIVFAALLRFHLLLLTFPEALAQNFPLLLGVYVTLLAVAAERRIAQQGGVLRTWYTRAHAWVLMAVSGLILGAGLVLAAFGEVRGGGVRYLVEDDLLVLVLVGVLGVGTQIFLAANLPTIFDLASSLARAFTTKRRIGDTPPFVYAAIIAVAAVTAFAIVAIRFDLLGSIGYFRDSRVALLLVAIPVAAAAFFGSAAIQIWREGRRGLYKKRISTRLRNDLIVYGLSSALGLAGGVLLVLAYAGRFDGWGPFTGQGLRMDLIAFTIVGTAGPIGVYLHRQDKRVDGIEARLPDFLSDLAETRRAGLTMSAALHSCALSDYGPLTAEVKKMSQQVGWGVSFNEALAQFAERVKTSLVLRSTSLIIEASRTGGSVAEILKAAAKDAHEIKGLENDRRVQMLTYLIVIYVVFGVFVLVIGVLDGQFIPQVLAANKVAAQTSGLGSQSFGNQNNVDIDSIHFAYFLGAMVQSVGNGMVGGVLSEGRVSSGFRHAALMAGISWVVFRFVL